MARIAKNWTNICESSHLCTEFTLPSPRLISTESGEPANAARTTVTGTLPKRLVDLRKFSRSSPKARLIDTIDIPPEETSNDRFYVTLSYCWGKAEFYKTIRADL